jgi:nucleoside-diphosphate-sugar epimerase
VVNNWQRAEPWQTHRELVLVTGGCSGIGRAIMEGLAKTGVRVVIMDVQAPNFKLRKFVSRFAGIGYWPPSESFPDSSLRTFI